MKVIVIGGGIASLSAASYLAKAGFEVELFEKNEQLGGRARQFESDEFVFDMGPSWYWMPEVFEKFFNDFKHSASDFYQLERLDPSYRVYWGQDDHSDIPANYGELRQMFESIETGAGKKLDEFLEDAQVKYDKGVGEMVQKPSIAITEFTKLEYLKPIFLKSIFTSFEKHARKYFKDKRLLQLVEFPILFLGATAKDTPSLYSLMNYADMKLGTWYPMGGMHEIIKAFEQVARGQGVKIHTGMPVESITYDEKSKAATGVVINGKEFQADVVLGGADYEHVDQKILPQKLSNYKPSYWDSRKLAPSALLYYVGVDKKIPELHHHNLFFDEDFTTHSKEIYTTKEWPTNPLFYVCCPSKTDKSVAPEGKENIFILIPVAVDLEDTEEVREQYFNYTLDKLEKYTHTKFRDQISFKRSYAHREFKADYNSFKGNAYGLANTLGQTAYLKPRLKNKNLKNLFYTGQLTVPGPGVPPSIISGEVVAKQIISRYGVTL